MLVALCNGARIEAGAADKGPEYCCPNCRGQVTLKKGREVIHHFAHKPPHTCAWGRGETRVHLDAKKLFKNEFICRGLHTEVECEVPSLLGPDRRADVLVWSPNEKRFAIELQHSAIDCENLVQRTQSYIREDVRVVWIPFLHSKYVSQIEVAGPDQEGDFRIAKFTPRPLEKWVHALYYGKPWMYDPYSKKLYQYKLKPYHLYKESAEWYDEYGDYQYKEGGEYKASRWKELVLWGPYRLNEVRICKLDRREWRKDTQYYPGGTIGNLLLLSEGKRIQS